MNQYIITEEQIASIEEHGWIDAFHTLDQVRSRPYNPQDGKKNYFGGECTCDKFVNCHDCRDAFSYTPQAERENVLDKLVEKMKKDYILCEEMSEKLAGHRAAEYYNSRSACLEHYIEFIVGLRQGGNKR